MFSKGYQTTGNNGKLATDADGRLIPLSTTRRPNAVQVDLVSVACFQGENKNRSRVAVRGSLTPRIMATGEESIGKVKATPNNLFLSLDSISAEEFSPCAFLANSLLPP